MGNKTPQCTYGVFRTDIPNKPGHSNELVCVENRDNPNFMKPAEFNGSKTILDLFNATSKRIPHQRFLGTRNNDKDGRPYEWKTFEQIHELMDQFARGSESLNLSPQIQAEGVGYKFMGIFAKNREEWAVVDLACMRSSVTIVPFFDSLGADALSFVINQTELITMCIEKSSFDLLIKVASRCKSLKNIVMFDQPTPEQKQKATEAGLQLYSYQSVLEEGKRQTAIAFNEPKPDTVYMFCYTSGTTGDPKGAKMSHAGFVATQHIVEYVKLGLREDDCSLSYLPYAHIFEQCNFIFSIARGYAHGYYSGDPLKLMDDIQTLKPTFFVTVPRILNRVHGKIYEGVATKTPFQQKVFHKAVRTKIQNMQQKGDFKHCFYDSKVFKPIRNLFGGRLRTLITASAPISGDVLDFFKVALGMHVFEVYGQTETNGPCTATLMTDPKGGHVGGVINSCKVRLRDVVEMGYLHTDNPPRGEIQYKGTHTFSGYFKAPDKTKEAFDEEGWVNTGDVAIVYPNGSIKIIDRAKNIFKLAQGEYIAPEKLENIYVQCPLIAQIFVHGDSLQSYLLSVIVLDPEALKKWATEKGREVSNLDRLALDEGLKKDVIAQMDAKAKEYGLNSLEKIKKVHLTTAPFTVDNDLITPTFKIKRNVAKKFFQNEIDKMYEEGLGAPQ